jgi:hypothetical protein
MADPPFDVMAPFRVASLPVIPDAADAVTAGGVGVVKLSAVVYAVPRALVA